MKQLIACLWFDGQAEEAMSFYTSIFRNAKAGEIMRWPEAFPGQAGGVLTASFEVGGTRFVALNGGPQFKFNEAVSFQIPCETQAEVDYYWEKLGAGGQYQPCGWLKDKFGVSWQVTPTTLIDMISDPDSAKAGRVMQTMMQMKKLEIAPLQQAYEGQAS
jgi:predicted 3-demethylubiquinone-9 3-methyltransferase (glyoxalase superfamily)